MKYKKLLEGLKIKEVSFEHLLMSDIIRMESEFYNSDRLVYPEIVTGEQAIVFSQYGTSEELNEINQGYPVLRLNEYDSSFIGIPSKYCHLLDEGTYKELSLKENDVLICRTNGNPKYVGKAALVPKDYPFAFASYLFRVRPNLKYINSATLVAYLNSKYGRIEIERYSMQSNQANFSPAKFREIAIPVFPKSLCKEIEKITYSAFEKLEEAREVYLSARNKLNTSLSLSPFKVQKINSSIKTLNATIWSNGRLDSEYYQLKYDHLFNELKRFECKKLSQLVSIHKSVEPGSDLYQKEGTPFIRVADLSIFGISSPNIFLDASGYSEVIRPKRDTILMSKDGTVGIAYKVEHDMDIITSSAILHLKVKDENILPDYLTTVINSNVVRQQAERDAGGSILQHWRLSEIENVVIPILPYETQEQIATMVRNSFELRKQSQILLDEARRMIEKEIENPSK